MNWSQQTTSVKTRQQVLQALQAIGTKLTTGKITTDMRNKTKHLIISIFIQLFNGVKTVLSLQVIHMWFHLGHMPSLSLPAQSYMITKRFRDYKKRM